MSYVFTDTAGLRHQPPPRLRPTRGSGRQAGPKRNADDDIETFAAFRSLQALERSGIGVVTLDATQPVSKQDKRIVGQVVEAGKGLILLLNKIDLVPASDREAVAKAAREALAFCRFAPLLPGSALSRQGLLKLFPLLAMVQSNRNRRIATSDLLRWYEDTVVGQPVGPLARSKHMLQADEVPPTFVVFVKDPKQVQVSQLRFLENRLRETFAFEGTPIRWVTKSG